MGYNANMLYYNTDFFGASDGYVVTRISVLQEIRGIIIMVMSIYGLYAIVLNVSTLKAVWRA